jgi:hypothetical protein
MRKPPFPHKLCEELRKIPVETEGTTGIEPAVPGNEMKKGSVKKFFIYKGGLFCYPNSVRRSIILTFQ